MKKTLLYFIFILVFVASVSINSKTAEADKEQEPSDNFQLQTYLTEEEALKQVFPDCDEILVDQLLFTPEEKQHLEKLLKRRLYKDGFEVFIGREKGKIRGYAIITEEIGKFHPFTFIVCVKPNGKIKDLAILVYRESRGSEIARKRFLYQFVGKSLKNPLRINKDIINITGATMSVRYMCAGVRKVLGVVKEYYLSSKRGLRDARPIQDRVNVAQEKMSTEVRNEAKSLVVEDTSKRKVAEKEEKREHKYEESTHAPSDIELIKETRMIMGTFAEISVYSNKEKMAGKAIEEALDEMERMDAIMSNYNKHSELSQVNRLAGKEPVKCSDILLDVIERSIFYSELSCGAFDITVYPLVDLWGFFKGEKHLPSGEEIKRLLPAVSYKNIEIKKSPDRKEPAMIFFKNIKTQIDLGAIGKGYAVDRALKIIKKYGIDNACINLGGNMYLLGTPAHKNAWKIGVQHPREKNKILGFMTLRNQATATSGDYERFFEIKGKRYSHVIDPRTGMPVGGTIAVTIIAATGTEVDALSTSVFVLGPEMGLQLINKIEGAEALIVHEGHDGEIVIDMTKGYKKDFTVIDHEGESNVRWNVVASGQ